MDWLHQLLSYVPSIDELVRAGGYPGLAAIIFAETGLLVGFFLPGDSLLVTAGLFAAKGDLNVWLLTFILMVASILGNTVGYFIGQRAGRSLFAREDSRLFKRRHLERAHAFYEKYGGTAVVLARFVPVVRTFVPTVAGAVEMPLARYTLFNVVGGVLWIGSMVLGGYVLGSYIPDIDKKIHYVIAVVVVLSLLPPVFEWWRERRAHAKRAAVADDAP